MRAMARDGRHIHAMFFRPMLDLAVQRVGRQRTQAVLRRLGTTEATLRDPTAWVSLGLTEQLCDALIEETEDPHFVEEACGLVTSGRYLWLLRPMLRLFGSPTLVYEQMAAAIPRFNRAGTLEIVDRGASRVGLTYASSLETNVQLCRGRIRQFAVGAHPVRRPGRRRGPPHVPASRGSGLPV